MVTAKEMSRKFMTVGIILSKLLLEGAKKPQAPPAPGYFTDIKQREECKCDRGHDEKGKHFGDLGFHTKKRGRKRREDSI